MRFATQLQRKSLPAAAPAAAVLARPRGFGPAAGAGAASGHDFSRVRVSAAPGHGGEPIQRVRTKAVPKKNPRGGETEVLGKRAQSLPQPQLPLPVQQPDPETDEVKEELEQVQPLAPVSGSREAFYESESDTDPEDPEHVGVQLTEEKKGGTGEFDGFRVERRKIYEDKRGNVLASPHPSAFSKKRKRKVAELTEEERAQDWAETQIFEKTRNRLQKLATATRTEAPKKSGRPVPDVDQFRHARQIKFRVESNHPTVKAAVRDQIDRLKEDPETRHITYTTKFASGPAKTAPEDDPGSKYYKPPRKK